MKWIARSIVFAGALAFGLAAAWVWSAIGLTLFEPSAAALRAARHEPGQVISPAGIRVVYNGIGRDNWFDDRAYLKFLVYNGSDSTLSYRAHSPQRPFPQVSVNGRKLEFGFRCGTGSTEHKIAPGGVAEFQIGYWDYLEKPASGSMMQVGFYLNTAPEGEAEIYTSEPFMLPEEFRRTNILGN